VLGLICGGVLCLADGLPWAYAGLWALRGVFAGLVAGTIVGALSGIYHVEATAPRPAPAALRKRPGGDGAFAAGRPPPPPATGFAPGSDQPSRITDYKERPWTQANRGT
jgi:hypothetical protein